MAIDPTGHTPKVPGTGPTRGTLGNAAALGFAIALGLLKGLGVSFTKVINASNEVQKAFADLVESLNDLNKFKDADLKDEPKFKEALKKMFADLKKLMDLLKGKGDWESGMPEEGKDLAKKFKGFLKELLGQLGDAFHGVPEDPNWPNDPEKNNYIRDWLQGKHDFDFNKFWTDGGGHKWWFLPFGNRTTRSDVWSDTAGKVGDVASQAQSQFATYQTRFAYIRRQVQNWVQVTEKAVEIQHKTAQFQISKI